MRVLHEEYKIISERREKQFEEVSGEKSYTKYLFREGINKILKKLGEESAELIIAAKDASAGSGAEDSAKLVIEETADLFYHVLIMLAELGIPLCDVEAELEERTRKTGNLKEFNVTDKNT